MLHETHGYNIFFQFLALICAFVHACRPHTVIRLNAIGIDTPGGERNLITMQD